MLFYHFYHKLLILHLIICFFLFSKIILVSFHRQLVFGKNLLISLVRCISDFLTFWSECQKFLLNSTKNFWHSDQKVRNAPNQAKYMRINQRFHYVRYIFRISPKQSKFSKEYVVHMYLGSLVENGEYLSLTSLAMHLKCKCIIFKMWMIYRIWLLHSRSCY